MHQRALIIIAHGSRNEEANREFEALVARIREESDGFDQVHPAFLELAEPTLQDAAEKAIEGGAGELVVYPLFFNQGKHVRRDLPALVKELREEFPDCTVKLLDYFGTTPDLAATVRHHIATQESSRP